MAQRGASLDCGDKSPLWLRGGKVRGCRTIRGRSVCAGREGKTAACRRSSWHSGGRPWFVAIRRPLGSAVVPFAGVGRSEGAPCVRGVKEKRRPAAAVHGTAGRVLGLRRQVAALAARWKGSRVSDYSRALRVCGAGRKSDAVPPRASGQLSASLDWGDKSPLWLRGGKVRGCRTIRGRSVCAGREGKAAPCRRSPWYSRARPWTAATSRRFGCAVERFEGVGLFEGAPCVRGGKEKRRRAAAGQRTA